jgi:hypothetical protein
MSITIADNFQTIAPPPEGEPNPLKDLAWIKKALLTVIDQQKRIIDMEMGRLFSVKDLADRFKISTATLYTNPWRLPNFGNPDVTAPNRWWGRTCDAWYSEPEADRRRRWEEMGSEERRRAMGATA